MGGRRRRAGPGVAGVGGGIVCGCGAGIDRCGSPGILGLRGITHWRSLLVQRLQQHGLGDDAEIVMFFAHHRHRARRLGDQEIRSLSGVSAGTAAGPRAGHRPAFDWRIAPFQRLYRHYADKFLPAFNNITIVPVLIAQQLQRRTGPKPGFCGSASPGAVGRYPWR